MDADVVKFTVIGTPASQGSKTAYVRGGRAVIVDGSSKAGRDKHATWRSQVANEARVVAERRGEPFSGPCAVNLDFFFPLPARDPHRYYHAVPVDVDKAIRSVLDSLVNAGLVVDDSLVSVVKAAKFYARDGHWTGVGVTITDLSSDEARERGRSKEQAKAAKKSRA